MCILVQSLLELGRIRRIRRGGWGGGGGGGGGLGGEGGIITVTIYICVWLCVPINVSMYSFQIKYGHLSWHVANACALLSSSCYVASC